jgi:hypothetical protein
VNSTDYNVPPHSVFSILISPPNAATAPSGTRSPHQGFTITLRHTTLGRTPLDGWSTWWRDLYLTIHNTHKTDSHAPSRSQTHNPNKQMVADPCLRPRSRWNQPILILHPPYLNLFSNTLHILYMVKYKGLLTFEQPQNDTEFVYIQTFDCVQVCQQGMCRNLLWYVHLVYTVWKVRLCVVQFLCYVQNLANQDITIWWATEILYITGQDNLT